MAGKLMTIHYAADMLDGQAFSPIKIDIQGNIQSLKTKYESCPKEFSTIESILLAEMEEKQVCVEN